MFFKGGKEQVSFLDGKVVTQNTTGATRPDIIVKKPGGSIKAVEVKNYDLENNLSQLKNELLRQVKDRVTNLPSGSTQEIALVTKGRGYTKAFTDDVVKQLQEYLFDAYGGKIPITVLG